MSIKSGEALMVGIHTHRKNLHLEQRPQLLTAQATVFIYSTD